MTYPRQVQTLLPLLWLCIVTCVAGAAESSLVYPGAAGRMLYDSRAQGDRIPDFSAVGYRYGVQPLPNVAQAMFVQPQAGDNTAHIQAAIDAVSACHWTPRDSAAPWCWTRVNFRSQASLISTHRASCYAAQERRWWHRFKSHLDLTDHDDQGA